MIYDFGECRLDTKLYTLQRGGKCIRLRPKVFRVCLYLLEHRDRVVSREELCGEVWSGRLVSQATVEGVIRSVREALGDSGHTQAIIQTLRGYGYRFIAGIEQRAPEEMWQEVSQPERLPVVPDSDEPLRPTGVAAGIEVGERWEAISGSALLGEVQGRQPDGRGLAPIPPVMMPAREQGATDLHSPLQWWLVAVGRGLAIVATVLLGAFGLWWGTSHEAMRPSEKARIAVLPFIDLSVEADQSSFAAGMMEELIAQLSQISGLTVIARTTVMKYQGSRKDVATIGRELGVGTILEGSIRKMDKQVRVNVQLIDVASQGHLWSQEYTRELTGVFAAQSEIATHLAHGLRVQLSAQPIYKRVEDETRFTALVHKIGLGK